MVIVRPDDSTKLWQRAGNRCAICRAELMAQRYTANEGYEFPIRPLEPGDAKRLVMSPAFLESYDNHILLCGTDVRVVSENRQAYTVARLTDLKAAHERMIERRTAAGDETAITLLVHTAFFLAGGPAHYFLKVANEGAGTLQLDRIWFETNPPVTVDNPQRPLPTLLESGGLFETWLLVEEVPTDPFIGHLARLRLGDGSIVKSRPNTDVLPAGNVGGGGKPLRSLIRSVAAANHDGDRLIEKEWDVFISYSHKDRAFVAPLADELRGRNLRTWYDKGELRIGDVLHEKIAEGIVRSAFSVIILSRSFFESGWGKYELAGLLTRSAAGGQVVLPIWHGITFEEILAWNPSLAGLVALDSAKVGLTEIADQIHEVVVESRQARG